LKEKEKERVEKTVFSLFSSRKKKKREKGEENGCARRRQKCRRP
jgi:hypothetical protein